MKMSANGLDFLNCCLSDIYDEHVVHEGLTLSCGGHCCKKCFEMYGNIKKCNHCNKFYDHMNDDSGKSSFSVEDKYFQRLFELLKLKFDESIETIGGQKFEEIMIKSLDTIEKSLNLRVDSLIEQLKEYSKELKSELDGIKERIRSLIKANELKTINETIHSARENMNKIENSSIKDSYYQNESILRKSMAQLNNLKRNIDKISFECSDIRIDKTVIGKIVIPFDLKYSQLKSLKTFKIKCELLSSVDYFKKIDKLLVIDTTEKTLKSIDLNGNLMETTSISKFLQKPVCLCVNDKHQIFIGDWKHKKIFIFNENLEFIRQFGEPIIRAPISMTIDNTDKENLLYVADEHNNLLSIWNEIGQFKQKKTINAPRNVKVNGNKIFILSSINNTSNELSDNNKFEKLSIIILHKSNLNILKTITMHNYIQPVGFQLNDEHGILLTAFENDENNNKMSDSRYLIHVDQYGNIMQKIYINDLKSLQDMILIGNKLFICEKTCFNIIELE